MSKPQKKWTVSELLRWATDDFANRKLASPRLDAEILLAHALQIPRIQLYVDFDRPATPTELELFRDSVLRRRGGEPVAYLVGSKGFWSFELSVDPRVLIPRPETELLVEEALKRIDQETPQIVVDIGTGTGAIALAIAKETNAKVAGIDVSPDALEVARDNAKELGLSERIEWIESNLFKDVNSPWNRPNMIVSNPPYVATEIDDGLEEAVARFEPALALFAGSDGMDILKQLIPQAHQALLPSGWFLCEIGSLQRDQVCDIISNTGFEMIEVYEDLAGHPRCICARKHAVGSDV
jgi:release factor glutamine methyltransferase